MKKFFDHNSSSATALAIIPVDKLSSEQRLKVADMAIEHYKPGEGSAFVGIGKAEIEAITGEKPSSSSFSFYALFTRDSKSSEPLYPGIFAIMWADKSIEMDGLSIDPSYRGKGYGILQILTAIYLAATKESQGIYHADILDISVLKQTAQITKLIELYQKFGAQLKGDGMYCYDGKEYPKTCLTLDLALLRKDSILLSDLAGYVHKFLSIDNPPVLTLIDSQQHRTLVDRLKQCMLNQTSSLKDLESHIPALEQKSPRAF